MPTYFRSTVRGSWWPSLWSRCPPAASSCLQWRSMRARRAVAGVSFSAPGQFFSGLNSSSLCTSSTANLLVGGGERPRMENRHNKCIPSLSCLVVHFKKCLLLLKFSFNLKEGFSSFSPNFLPSPLYHSIPPPPPLDKLVIISPPPPSPPPS